MNQADNKTIQDPYLLNYLFTNFPVSYPNSCISIVVSHPISYYFERRKEGSWPDKKICIYHSGSHLIAQFLAKQ
nr:hypothetical protein Q903MT_gene5239 [Picea sitchensis]